MCIIASVLRNKKKRHKTYEQLMVGISCFDMIGSVPYLFEHWLLPADITLPGSVGNHVTCKIQGVMFQLGFGTILFNLLLAIYFWLVVHNVYTESQIQSIRGDVLRFRPGKPVDPFDAFAGKQMVNKGRADAAACADNDATLWHPIAHRVDHPSVVMLPVLQAGP